MPLPHCEWIAPSRVQKAIELVDGMINKGLQRSEVGTLIQRTELPNSSVEIDIQSSFSSDIRGVFSEDDRSHMTTAIWSQNQDRIMDRCNSFISRDLPKIIDKWLIKLLGMAIFEPMAPSARLILSGEEAIMANFGMLREEIVGIYQRRMNAMLRVIKDPAKVVWKVGLDLEGVHTYKYNLAATAKFLRKHTRDEWSNLLSNLTRNKDNFDDHEGFMQISNPWGTEFAVEVRGVS